MRTAIAIVGKINERRIRAGGTSVALKNFAIIFNLKFFPGFMTERKVAANRSNLWRHRTLVK